MKTQPALNTHRIFAAEPPASTEASQKTPPRVRASKAEAARARSSAAASTAEARGGSPVQPATPSTLGSVRDLFQAGYRHLMRDPFGTALRLATAYFALAPRAASAQPLVGRASRIQPLPGSELESVPPRSHHFELAGVVDLGDEPATAREARTAVIEKRKGHYFDGKGPKAGGLGRRRLRERSTSDT